MTVFGWCLDGHHRNCRERIPVPGGTTTCDCWCHRKGTIGKDRDK